MAVIIFVITVAPQKLIWPHGKVYPKKAMPAESTKIITPEAQTHWRGVLYD